MDIVEDRPNTVVHDFVDGTERCVEVGSGEFGLRSEDAVAFHDFLRGQIKAVVIKRLYLMNLLVDEACVGDGGNDVSSSSLTFGSNHGGTLPNSSHGFAQSSCAANKGNAVIVLVDMEIRVCGCQHLALVNHVNAHGLKNTGFTIVSDS